MAGRRFRIGFLLNPIAGLGGRPGFKGSDDSSRIRPLLRDLDPLELPAYQRSLEFLTDLSLPGGVVATAPGPLGEAVLKESLSCGGPIFEVVRDRAWSKELGSTDASDTARFVRLLAKEDLDLLVFSGGDGTAVDVARAAGPELPILGVPAGVKMFSGVFAETPIAARALVQGLRSGFRTQEADVLDLDEASYREGSFVVQTRAHASIPVAEGIQVAKGGSIPTEAESLADLVAWFQGAYDPGTSYVLGAGTTLGALKRALGGGSALGVDVYRAGRFVVTDGGEPEILHALEEAGAAQVIASPTSQQGCILGRGTAQISPAVLERVGIANVVVLATPAKLLGLRDLFVDTGDTSLDRQFPDYIKVRTDPWTEKVFKIRRPPSPVRSASPGPGAHRRQSNGR